MSEVDARFVKRGLWTRLDEGSIAGQTITADVQVGTIIVALLAILASVGTAHLWNIVVFFVHQIRATGFPEDGLFRQQQVLLRTLPTPASLLADSAKLWVFWRRRVDRAFFRSLIPLFLAIIFCIGTVAVGIFSSYIVTGNSLQVLIASPHCGPLNIDPSVDGFVNNAYGLQTYEAKVVSISKSYAEDCYQNDSRLPTRCGIFITPYIPFARERVACPFGSSCVDADRPAIQFDSGLVDLNSGLGLNLAAKDRVKCRRRTTCAVLDVAKQTTIVKAADYPYMDHTPFPGEEMLVVYFGDSAYETPWPNATFGHSLAVSNITRGYTQDYGTAYGNSVWADMNDFIPIPEMNSADQDLVIAMVWMNSMNYQHPIDDIFFAAHQSDVYATARGTDETLYYADYPASGMGCAQQYQFCFARKGQSDYCSDLTGLPGKVTIEDYPGSSEVQRAAIQTLITSSLLFDISDASLVVLKANDLAGGSGFVNYLPDDQWIQEAAGWESFVWAALQTAITDYAIGADVREPSARGYMRNETTTGENELCKAQRLRKSGGFILINAFGLALITAFSIFVAGLDFMLLRFLITLSRFRRAMAPKIDRWIQDGVFQLQRRVYEAHGEGTWQHLDKEVPVTSGNERLGEFPLSSAISLGTGMTQNGCDGCCAKKLQSMKSWATETTVVEERPWTQLKKK